MPADLASYLPWNLSAEQREQLQNCRAPSANDVEEKRALFRETHSRTVDRQVNPLPGSTLPKQSMMDSSSVCPDPVPVAYRAFDRQWIIPDNRVLDRSSPELWESRIPGQIRIVEQHSKKFGPGPAILFSVLLPDHHHFDGRGGRVLSLLQKDGTPNVAPGLLQHLTNSYGDRVVSAEDLAAYIAAITAHPDFTSRFGDELTTRGVRVPLTGDAALWSEALSIGRTVIWASTFGERCVDPGDGRPGGADQVWGAALPTTTYQKQVGKNELPERFLYDPDRLELRLGSGVFGPVTPGVREYQVSGQNVLDGWLRRRSGPPSPKASSELDSTRPDQWLPAWSEELQHVLAVLWHLVDVQPAQSRLLDRVIDAPLISVDELLRRGVLPVPDIARRSAPAPSRDETIPGTEGIELREPHAVRPIAPEGGTSVGAPTPRPRKSREPGSSRPYRKR